MTLICIKFEYLKSLMTHLQIQSQFKEDYMSYVRKRNLKYEARGEGRSGWKLGSKASIEVGRKWCDWIQLAKDRNPYHICMFYFLYQMIYSYPFSRLSSFSWYHVISNYIIHKIDHWTDDAELIELFISWRICASVSASFTGPVLTFFSEPSQVTKHSFVHGLIFQCGVSSGSQNQKIVGWTHWGHVRKMMIIEKLDLQCNFDRCSFVINDRTGNIGEHYEGKEKNR